MRAALKAASAYFALVFAAGFALGAVRVLLAAPSLGPVAAVLIESPVMLGISWITARVLIARFAVPDAVDPRLIMGGVALALLLAAEAFSSVALFGRALDRHFAAYLTSAGAIGLTMQVAFAALPLLLRSKL